MASAVTDDIQQRCIAIIDAIDSGWDPSIAGGLSSALCFSKSRNKAAEAHEGAEQLASVLKVMRSSYELLSVGATATQREIYYLHGNWFASQDSSQEAISTLTSLLGVPKHRLGFYAAARGWISGAVLYEASTSNEADARPVPAEAVCERQPIRLEDGCDFILVVEKECIFRRLCEDRVWEQPGMKCCIVTGCGFPDLATRALVHQLWSGSGARRQNGLRVPVYGLADWNVFGLGVLLSYTRASKAHPESGAWSVPLQWLGLRAADIEAFELPLAALQSTSAVDDSRAAALLNDDLIVSSPALFAEVNAWIDSCQKMELEGILGRGLTFLARGFLPAKIAARDAIPLLKWTDTR